MELERIQSLQSNPPGRKTEIENYYANAYGQQENFYRIEIVKSDWQLSELKGKKTIRDPTTISINEEQRIEKIPRIDSGPSSSISFFSKTSAHHTESDIFLMDIQHVNIQNIFHSVKKPKKIFKYSNR